MNDIPYLKDVLIFLAAAVCIVPVFQRLRSSPILGYLAVGLLIGPHGLAFVNNSHSVNDLAELGIIFLLFAIGLELSFSKLRALAKYIFGLGGLQVLTTGLVFTAASYLLGASVNAAIIIGFGLALSSTAFCTKILADQNANNSPRGRLSIAILVMQDLMVVPLLTLVPLLNQSHGSGIVNALLIAVFKATIAVGLIIMVGRLVLNPILRVVAAHRNSELFMAATLLVVLGTGWLTAKAGLSVELGAFLAGLFLAESEYRHQVEADIRPFRGILIGLFFVTIGMKLDLHLALVYWWQAILVLVAVMLLKAGILFALSRSVFKLPKNLSLQVSLLLSQSGEFSFLLFALAMSIGILSPALGQFLLLVVALTMVLTPLMAFIGRRIELYVERNRPYTALAPVPAHGAEELSPQVIIAGFGRVGHLVADLLTEYNIAYVALDINAKHVHACRRRNFPVYYGDASHVDLLNSLDLAEATAAVITLDEPHAAERTVITLRKHFPAMKIYVRARDRQHANSLLKEGADDIVLETVEASLQLGGLMLSGFGLDADNIQKSLENARKKYFE